MTREELKDLLMLATMHTHLVARQVSDYAFESALAHFIAKHVKPMPDEDEQDSLPTAADVRGILKPELEARTAPWVCMICRKRRAQGWLVMKIHSSAAPKITCFPCAHAACWNDKLSGCYISFAEMAGIEEDAELNAICEERAGMPTVAVDLGDLRARTEQNRWGGDPGPKEAGGTRFPPRGA